MTTETATDFSIRQFNEKTDDNGETERGAYVAFTGRNALGKTTTIQVPVDVLANASGLANLTEEQLRNRIVEAQAVYDEFKFAVAEASDAVNRAHRNFVTQTRRIFGFSTRPVETPVATETNSEDPGAEADQVEEIAV